MTAYTPDKDSDTAVMLPEAREQESGQNEAGEAAEDVVIGLERDLASIIREAEKHASDPEIQAVQKEVKEAQVKAAEAIHGAVAEDKKIAQLLKERHALKTQLKENRASIGHQYARKTMRNMGDWLQQNTDSEQYERIRKTIVGTLERKKIDREFVDYETQDLAEFAAAYVGEDVVKKIMAVEDEEQKRAGLQRVIEAAVKVDETRERMNDKIESESQQRAAEVLKKDRETQADRFQMEAEQVDSLESLRGMIPEKEIEAAIAEVDKKYSLHADGKIYDKRPENAFRRDIPMATPDVMAKSYWASLRLASKDLPDGFLRVKNEKGEWQPNAVKAVAILVWAERQRKVRVEEPAAASKREWNQNFPSQTGEAAKKGPRSSARDIKIKEGGRLPKQKGIEATDAAEAPTPGEAPRVSIPDEPVKGYGIAPDAFTVEEPQLETNDFLGVPLTLEEAQQEDAARARGESQEADVLLESQLLDIAKAIEENEQYNQTRLEDVDEFTKRNNEFKKDFGEFLHYDKEEDALARVSGVGAPRNFWSWFGQGKREYQVRRKELEDIMKRWRNYDEKKRELQGQARDLMKGIDVRPYQEALERMGLKVRHVTKEAAPLRSVPRRAVAA